MEESQKQIREKLESARPAAYEAAERNGSMEADLEAYWETMCGDVHLARKIISESGCDKNEILTLAREALRFGSLLEGFDHYLDRVNYALGRMSACLNDQPKLKRDMLRLRLTVLHRIEAQSGHELGTTEDVWHELSLLDREIGSAEDKNNNNFVEP